MRVVHSQGDVTRRDAGRPRRMFGTMQDITDFRRAEAELRGSEARFRAFVDHATDAFFLHERSGTILDVNRQACESLGYSRDELWAEPRRPSTSSPLRRTDRLAVDPERSSRSTPATAARTAPLPGRSPHPPASGGGLAVRRGLGATSPSASTPKAR